MNRQQRRAAERARGKALGRAAQTGDSSALVGTAKESLAEGRLSEAEQLARGALTRGADDGSAQAILVTSLRRQGRLDEAMLAARRLAKQRAKDPAAHEALGFVLLEQDRLPEAIVAFEKALALLPERWSAHVGLGNCLSAVGMLGDSADHLRRAIELAPDQPAAHSDLARTLFRMGSYEAAADRYERATQRAGGTPALIEWNRSLALLGMGALRSGWDAYEAGFVSGARIPNRDPEVPRWAGEDLTDSTLLVWGEQGLGDEVRFASCFPDVIRAAGHLVIEAAPRLVSIFARSFPDATVRAETFDRHSQRETADLDDIDVHCPAGSLPRFLRRTIDSFPDHEGYLVTAADQREDFRDRLSGLPAGLRVGICWRSGKLDTSRLANYLTLDEWAPLLRLGGLTFVNLQYGDVAFREKELSEVESTTGTHIHRWSDVDYTNDLESIAALTRELDVVVGPNSFPVMLAGALGVPTVTLHPPSIWTHSAEHDPWFPRTTHLVRQWDQSWGPVVDQVAQHLSRLRDA